MTKDLYKDVYNFNNIRSSYNQAQKGKKKFKKEAIVFDMCRERNLLAIWREMKNKNYEVGEYIRFKVHEPKERMVSAPRVRDKIVQFAVHNILQEVYRSVFIKTSYACLENKGTHKAVENVQHNMRVCKWKHGDGWVLKMDVRRFFYSIDRDILKQILLKKIKDTDMIWILNKIIDSSPEGEKGIPLGNVTSQDFANIYLNEVDQFCKRYLGIKYYTRYMDDIVIITSTKEKAQEYLQKITTFLNEKLDLETNAKTKIFPIDQGVNAYGFKIWTTHRLLRDQSKQAMKRRIKAMDKKLQNDAMEEKEIIQAVNSWLGHARHSNSYNLAKKIFKKYSYIKVEGENKFGSRILRNN